MGADATAYLWGPASGPFLLVRMPRGVRARAVCA